MRKRKPEKMTLAAVADDQPRFGATAHQSISLLYPDYSIYGLRQGSTSMSAEAARALADELVAAATELELGVPRARVS